MRLQVNDSDEIIAYATLGDINDSTEYAGTVPDGFYENYKPSFYLLQNNEIVENPNYVAPKPPEIKPSDLEKQVATLSYQQMVDSQTIETLQQQNAQMAYQIMTGGNA